MSEFSSLNEIILNLFSQKGWSKGIELLKIRKAWKNCVGDFVASQTQPVKIKGGILFVGVKNNFLMAELKLNQTFILDRIKEFTGINLKDIKFYIFQEKNKKYKINTPQRLAPHEAKRLKEQITQLKDPEVREILSKTIDFLEEKNE